MNTLHITTKSSFNFPVSYAYEDQLVDTRMGTAHAFVFSAKRAKQECSHVEIHHLDGTIAFRAEIVAIVECSGFDEGRNSVMYANAVAILNAAQHGKNPVTYRG